MGFISPALPLPRPSSSWSAYLPDCETDYLLLSPCRSTTFIIPGEVFPTRYRSTCHGISAASGKLGAIVAQVGFSRLANIGGKNKFVKVSPVARGCSQSRWLEGWTPSLCDLS